MRHSRGITTGAALAATALALTALPSLAGAVTSSPTDAPARTAAGTALTADALRAAEEMPAGALKAMQRDFGITAEQARERVANEHRAGEIAPALAEDLAD
ncbi:S1 family peptidase, partial [Streptomyces verrucosisporus]|nr:S1 family peptidase [Streptomyces verrucosisporus]